MSTIIVLLLVFLVIVGAAIVFFLARKSRSSVATTDYVYAQSYETRPDTSYNHTYQDNYVPAPTYTQAPAPSHTGRDVALGVAGGVVAGVVADEIVRDLDGSNDTSSVPDQTQQPDTSSPFGDAGGYSDPGFDSSSNSGGSGF